MDGSHLLLLKSTVHSLVTVAPPLTKLLQQQKKFGILCSRSLVLLPQFSGCFCIALLISLGACKIITMYTCRTSDNSLRASSLDWAFGRLRVVGSLEGGGVPH
jgi:hypothetical protein